MEERGTALSRMRERERTEAKPKPPKPAAPKPTTQPTAGGEVIWGGGPYSGGTIKRRNSKDEAELAELHRRLEWAEGHQGRAPDFETIHTNLMIELGYENRLRVARALIGTRPLFDHRTETRD